MLDFYPKTTNEMVFTNTHTHQLVSSIVNRSISFPSNGKNTLLLFGVYGSGKTTYASIFFNEYEKAFGGEEAYVNRVVADSNQKITTIIEHIDNIALYISPNKSDKHYFLFDEVDGFSIEQQKRLKSWLNRDDVVCVMTTNYLHKIDKGLLSRSYQLEFNKAEEVSQYVARFKEIIQQNNLPMLDDDTLNYIATSQNGDWREMCALLQQACAFVKDAL